MKFSIYQESRRGTRKNNQDRIGYSYSRDALLMVLADGMGGHLHGEVASHIAVQFLTEAFQREAAPALPDPGAFLQKTITAAHHAIADYARGKLLSETPRTTCVACVIQNGMAHWGHVGDSRLYHIRDGRVQARTKDHTRVQMLVDEGRIREEAVRAHPERNRVLNCLGSARLPKVEMSRTTLLHSGDTLLLCSDGLWAPLSARMIAQGLSKAELTQSVPELLDLAELRAGSDCDNLSAVALTWADEPVPQLVNLVSTTALQPNTITTEIEDFGSGPDKRMLTDDEIEQAIQEIRDAIRKNTAR
jgi:serine/threonine protein phosphatase PrpC